MTSLIDPSSDAYTRVSRLATGAVTRQEKRLYKTLLETALETMEGTFEDKDVSYGIKDDNFHIREEKDREDPLPGMRRFPTFEEFVRMKEQGKKEDEDHLLDTLDVFKSEEEE